MRMREVMGNFKRFDFSFWKDGLVVNEYEKD